MWWTLALNLGPGEQRGSGHPSPITAGSSCCSSIPKSPPCSQAGLRTTVVPINCAWDYGFFLEETWDVLVRGQSVCSQRQNSEPMVY